LIVCGPCVFAFFPSPRSPSLSGSPAYACQPFQTSVSDSSEPADAFVHMNVVLAFITKNLQLTISRITNSGELE
jgi:hypothetical protein